MSEQSQWPEVARTTVTTWGGVEPTVQITALVVFMVICVVWIYFRKVKQPIHSGGLPIEAFTAIVNELSQNMTTIRDAIEHSSGNLSNRIEELSRVIDKNNRERCAICKFGAFHRDANGTILTFDNDGG